MKINVGAMDRALRVGVGALLIGLAASDVVGLWGSIGAVPFLTGLWLPGYLFGVPGAFDIGVYFVVFGTLTAIALALEDDGEAN